MVVTLILCLAALAGSGPLAARTIILNARGPSASAYPAGKTLSEPFSVTLRQGDTLTLLDGRGTTVLKGPTTIRGKVSVPLSVQDYAFVSALTQARPKVVRAAGVSFNLDEPTLPTDNAASAGEVKGFSLGRKAAPAARRPSVAAAAAPRPRPGVASRPAARPEPGLWDIDPSAGSAWCVEPSGDVALFRPVATRTLSLSVAGAQGPATAAWPAGETLLRLPNVVSGTQAALRIGWRDASGTTPEQSYQLTVHRIETELDSIRALALAFDSAGCDAQLSRLEALYRDAAP